MSCADVQDRLTDAFLAREDAGAEDLDHAACCAACGPHAEELRAVGRHLEAVQVPAPRAAFVAACEARALQALRAQRAARAPVPLHGLAPDMIRAAALALLALPVAVGHAWLVAWAGARFLGPWIPGPVLGWLGVFYFLPVALGLGVLYGVIPLAVVVGRRGPLEES